MKRWILPLVAVAIAGAIAWPFVFGGGTVEVKGRSFSVEHRISDTGDLSRDVPTRNRAALEAGQAILCSWDRDRYLYFWSDGSKAGFDVAFLDAAGKVLQTGRINPFKGRGSDLDDEGLASQAEARRALFLPEGTVESLSLSVGDTVALSSDLARAKPEPMTSINILGKSVLVEVVDTGKRRSRGLMHRPSMSKDEGMLFLYPKEQSSPYLSFYMRNTLMSLDIAYFDASGKLVNVVPTARAENPGTKGAAITAPAQGAAQYVLEVPYGWFRDNGFTDDKGKPAKPVSFEVTEDLRRRASTADKHP